MALVHVNESQSHQSNDHFWESESASSSYTPLSPPTPEFDSSYKVAGIHQSARTFSTSLLYLDPTISSYNTTKTPYPVTWWQSNSPGSTSAASLDTVDPYSIPLSRNEVTPQQQQRSLTAITPFGSLSSVDTTLDTGRRCRYVCTICTTSYPGAHELEQHAKISGHIPFRCKRCPKAYSRRDVYLRHKATHKDGGHVCKGCQKVLSRKDHFNQHVRTCRAVCNLKHERQSQSTTATTCAASDRDFDHMNRKVWADEKDALTGYQSTDDHTAKRQMMEITRALGNLLGNDHSALIGKLQTSVESVDGPSMKLLAEHMTRAAVLQAQLTASRSSML